MKEYLIFGPDGHEYIVTESDTDLGTLYKMYRSDNKIWYDHVKGSVAISLLDDGNGVKILREDEKDFSPYNYNEVLCLAILFKINVTHSVNYTPYKIIPTTQSVNL